MNYLISGMPRCRSAWLTAVLRAHGSRAYHDIYARGFDLNGDYGVVDPAIALFTPNEALDTDPTVTKFCLYADDLTDRIDALAKASDTHITDIARLVWAENFCQYRRHVPGIHVDDLDDDERVGEIVKACTRQAPSSDIISTFQLLKIEEHMPKARLLLSSPGKRLTSVEFQKSLDRILSGMRTIRDESPTVLRTPPSQTSG